MRTISWHSAAVVVVLAMCSVGVAEDAMQWQPNLETAQRVAGQTNRLVLVHFWAPWCKPCMRVEQEVFSKPDVGRALEANYVCVKVNVDEFPSTTRLYGVAALPSDVVITPTGRLVSSSVSSATPNIYIEQMNRVAAGHRQLAQQSYAQASQGPAAAAQQAQQQPAQQQVAQGAAPPSVPVQPPVDDRYKDYYKQTAAQQQPAPPYGQQQLPQQYAPPAQPPVGPPQTAVAQQPVGPQVGAPQVGAQPPAVGVQQPQVASRPAVQLPPGSPPLGLDGNCPVTLAENKRWVPGIPRFGAVHRGRTYLFIGQEEQKRFLANPDAYSPVISGNDPVLALNARQAVAGRREHGVFYNNRIYLFAGEESLQEFNRNPHRYEAQVLSAMQTNPGGSQIR